MSGFTKEIIAKTFTELLDEKPMSKITVKDIVERCGVNRNTFYYHFKDIPDVVEFILKKKWDEILEHPQDRASILECMEEMADLVRNNRKVMFNVYRSVKKDTFFFYLVWCGIYWIRDIDLFRVWKGMSKCTSGWRKP